MVVFLDANTQFGMPMGSVVGDSPIGVTSSHAPNAVVALDELGLSIAGTFDGVAREGCSRRTWYCRASDQWLPIDHIATTAEIVVVKNTLGVIDKFDTAAPNWDHVPLSQEIRLPKLAHQPIIRRRVAQYSRENVRHAILGTDPTQAEAAQGFSDHMWRSPAVSNVVEATTDRFLTHQHVVDGLITHFPAAPKLAVIKKKHLSHSTILLIRKKLRVLRACTDVVAALLRAC